MRNNVVECLFSLFTSSDQAVAIAGDLAEEREQRGAIGFWLDVASVTLSLWRNASTESPFQVLALIMAGLVLLAAPAFGGVAATFLVPQLTASHWGWIGLPLFWWGGAFWTGVSLVVLAPRRGMAACTGLALAGGVLLIGFIVAAVWRGSSNTDLVFFCTTGLIAAIPLLTGAAFARRRLAGCAFLAEEQHR